MDNIESSVLSLIREYGSQIHSALKNAPPVPSCRYNQNAQAETLSIEDRNLFEIVIVGAGCLLVPDMTYRELSQLITDPR